MDLAGLVRAAESMPPYPVANWHPERAAEIDIVIQADGQWFHEGRVIERHKLVQLFSRLLVFRDDAYWLVTPAEQLKITVETLPFLIVSAAQQEANLGSTHWHFITQVGDTMVLTDQDQWHWQPAASDQHPRVRIRDNLWAYFSRQVYYQLALTVEPSPPSDIVGERGETLAYGHITSADQAFLFGKLN